MATAHKFSTMEKARDAFPNMRIRHNETRDFYSVYNSKEERWVRVDKGQYIVSIADRFEVHDEEPENAKSADAKKSETKGNEAPAKQPNTTVSPENLAAPQGTDAKSDK